MFRFFIFKTDLWKFISLRFLLIITNESASVSSCRENVGWASTCNSVGQTAGYFLGSVVFLALESADFCNAYLRSEPQSTGLITIQGNPAFNFSQKSFRNADIEIFYFVNRVHLFNVPVTSIGGFAAVGTVGHKINCRDVTWRVVTWRVVTCRDVTCRDVTAVNGLSLAINRSSSFNFNFFFARWGCGSLSPRK